MSRADLRASRESAENARRATEEEASAWAALLAGALPRHTPREEPFGPARRSPELATAASGQGNSSGNQGSGADSTARGQAHPASGAAQCQNADTPGVNEAGRERLVLNLDSETLGRVQLVVDRDEGGVRVLVGTEPDARHRLSEGKHTLGEALSAAGVRVNSLRFVNASEIGTVLASDQVNRRRRPAESDNTDDTDKKSTDQQQSKKSQLNLVG